MEAKHEMTFHIAQSELLTMCLFWAIRAENKMIDIQERERCKANKEKIYVLLSKEQQSDFKNQMIAYVSNIHRMLESASAFKQSFKKIFGV
jgi:hypothetical protein